MTSDAPKSLGILVTRGPETGIAHWGLEIATAAVRRGHRVELFLMNDGAELLRSADPGLFGLPGLAVAVCSQTVISRGLPLDVPHVDYASQFQLARSVASCDRFLSLP